MGTVVAEVVAVEGTALEFQCFLSHDRFQCVRVRYSQWKGVFSAPSLSRFTYNPLRCTASDVSKTMLRLLHMRSSVASHDYVS